MRSILALLCYGATGVATVVALVLTGLPISDELSLLAVILAVGAPISIGVAWLIGIPLARERDALKRGTRAEVRESVRRFGEALRWTSLEGEEAPDIAPLMRVVLETGVAAVQARRGVIYRFDRAHHRLMPVSAYNVEGPPNLGVGGALAGWVASHRATLRLPVAAGDHPLPAPGEPDDATALGVPLETSDQLLGVLIVHGCTRGTSFIDADLETLSLLARQASVGADNVLLHHEAKRLSVTDTLTGLANVRAFRERLAIEFERSVRFQRPLSLAIVDIDHFKEINDEFGHLRGDAVLADLAARMVASTRGAIDLVARYGGEEFAIILPETDAVGAAAVAEKVRLTAAQVPFAGGEQHVHATVSVGFATYPDHAADAGALIQAADLALYEAKRAGRNRVGSPTRFAGADTEPKS